MNILVTGASGQLGKCIQGLAQEHSDLIFSFTDIPELDITDENSVNSYFEENSFDYCINCAAFTAVDLAESQKNKAYLINAEAVRILTEACNVNNCVLIHISTDFVFDGEKKGPYNEKDIPNPINVYGKSKLQGEFYVQEILKNYFIIRTSWVYSEHGKNFLKTMLRLGHEMEEINVVDDQMGSPTYAADLAAFILFLITNKRQEYGLYHYSNEGTISWYDFAVKIFEVAELNLKVNSICTAAYPTQAKRPKRSNLSKTKTINTFKITIPLWSDSLINCFSLLKTY
ncbi:MAG: dTDP-4-dehydrorhamnose reductase [Saonia sp.]